MEAQQFIFIILEILVFSDGISKHGLYVFCKFEAIESLPVNSTGKVKLGEDGALIKLQCDSHFFVVGLSSMGVANAEDVGVLSSSSKDVEDFCSKLEQALNNMAPVIVDCELNDELKYFRTLLTGLSALNSRLCNDVKFKAKYKKVQECINKLYWEFESCEGPVQWIRNKDQTMVCDTFKDIETCVYLKAGILCSKRAARMMKQLVVESINPMLKVACENVKSDPKIPSGIEFAKYSSSPVSKDWGYVLFGGLLICIMVNEYYIMLWVIVSYTVCYKVVELI